MSERLRSAVEATNKANAIANELNERLGKTLVPFVGKPILTKEGCLRCDVKRVIGDFPNDEQVRVTGHLNGGTFLAFDVSYIPRGSVYSARAVAYVGHINAGKLECLTQTERLRTDWTLEEVLQKRAAIETARKAYREAENALPIIFRE